MGRPIVIGGGGISGLFLADWFSSKFPKEDVILIESESQCGGLLRSFSYPDGGKFDYGTHIMSETSNRELDDYVKGLLPMDHWKFLVDERRDLSSLYFHGRVQFETAFPDLRDLPDDLHRRCVEDFFKNVKNQSWKDATNLRDRLRGLMGNVIADEVLIPAAESFWGMKAEKLGVMAGKLIPLEQVYLLRAPPTQEQAHDPDVQWRLILEDQRAHQVNKKCFYPKTRGIHQVVDSVLNNLKRKNVRVLCDTKIKSVKKCGNSHFELSAQNKDSLSFEAKKLFWTAHCLNLATPSGVKVSYEKMDPPLSTVVCHFLLSEAPLLKDVYHTFCIDRRVRIFRISNYRNYCDEANTPGRYPITVEMILTDKQFDEGDFINHALNDLKVMGVIDDSHKVLFSAQEILKYGFPLMSVTNYNEIKAVRETLKEALGRNMKLFGILSRDEIFFMKDIFLDTFEFVQRYEPDA